MILIGYRYRPHHDSQSILCTSGTGYSMIQSMLLLFTLRKTLTNKVFELEAVHFYCRTARRGYWSFLSLNHTPLPLGPDVLVELGAGLKEQKSTGIQKESMIENVENERRSK